MKYVLAFLLLAVAVAKLAYDTDNVIVIVFASRQINR